MHTVPRKSQIDMFLSIPCERRGAMSYINSIVLVSVKRKKIEEDEDRNLQYNTLLVNRVEYNLALSQETCYCC